MMTTDGWTSRAVESYVSLTFHYLTENFENNHKSLGCTPLLKSHTSENIEQFLDGLYKNGV